MGVGEVAARCVGGSELSDLLSSGTVNAAEDDLDLLGEPNPAETAARERALRSADIAAPLIPLPVLDGRCLSSMEPVVDMI